MPDAPISELNETNKGDSNGSSASAPIVNRELTQTDKLNKKLLQSLLNRMNQGDACLATMMNNSEDDRDADEWDAKQ